MGAGAGVVSGYGMARLAETIRGPWTSEISEAACKGGIFAGAGCGAAGGATVEALHSLEDNDYC